MNHFLEISQLPADAIMALIQKALLFKTKSNFPSYKHHAVGHLFYENSTRTRISFERAASHLSLPSITVDLEHSSENKGEMILDTLKNLAAMGIDCFVIRHNQEGLQQQLANSLPGVHIINAGDGVHAHPSQALLDMVTIIEQKPSLADLNVALIGNIKHSRVANSFQCICKLLGVRELRLIAPTIWQPTNPHFGDVTDNLKEGLKDADVVMCLRVQKERLAAHENLDLAYYRDKFALTAHNLAYAKPDAMVMHPGPMNRGIEIDSEIADGAQSFILQQVTNGVYARMAILDAVLSGIDK